jgi:hypothetical protein
MWGGPICVQLGAGKIYLHSTLKVVASQNTGTKVAKRKSKWRAVAGAQREFFLGAAGGGGLTLKLYI